MKINAGQLEKGIFLNHNGEIYQVVEMAHNYRGRGSAWLKVKLKNAETARVLEETFSPDTKIDKIDVENRRLSFLYASGPTLHFMNNETYEQFEVPAEKGSAMLPYLKEGQEMFVLVYAGKPLAVRPLNKVILKVTAAEEAVKGNTASTARKIVTVETGAKINVPLFIKKGDSIVISPETGGYLERA